MKHVSYACTHIEKMASEDSYEDGCSLSSVCIISENANVRAKTLSGLIKKLGETYFLKMDDIFLSDEDEDGSVTHISFNQLETADSNEPSQYEIDQWKSGLLKLFLCDYTFAIEKRVVSPITASEFKKAKIKTH